MGKISKLTFTLMFLLFFSGKLCADILYLKNGRSLEGLIKEEGENFVELEVYGGTVKLGRGEIEKIERSTPEGNRDVLLEWERKKIKDKEMFLKRQLEERRKEEYAPKKLDFAQKSGHITLNAKLNKKIDALLILDTGASLVVLSRDMGKKLGLNLDRLEPDVKLILPDGRQLEAKHIVLESLRVENVEAENVDAAVMLEKASKLDFGDGLLGMSFLKRFNFKVDQKENKLILEKF